MRISDWSSDVCSSDLSGPIRRVAPIEAQDAAFLRRHSTKPVKLTLPGPFTMTQQAENGYYPDARALAMDYADAVNAEVKDLFAAGVDVVQLAEPYLQALADDTAPYAIEAIHRALAGAGGPTAPHISFGYAMVPHCAAP